METRTLEVRLDTKISIIMNVFDAHFEASKVLTCWIARERWEEWGMGDGDGTEVGYINVFCAGRTLASVSHTLAVFYQNSTGTQPMTVFCFSKNHCT